MKYVDCLNCKAPIGYSAKGPMPFDCKACGEIFIWDGEKIKSKLPPEEAAKRKSDAEKAINQKLVEAQESGDFSVMSSQEIAAVTSNIILTTAFEVPNKKIDHVVEVVSAECVYGMHIFKDFFAGVRDVFGGRSKAIQDTLRDARKTALAELRREALMVGADAIIGVALDYHEVSGGGKNGMIMLVASGTAVKLK